jgi:hypothetical protein
MDQSRRVTIAGANPNNNSKPPPTDIFMIPHRMNNAIPLTPPKLRSKETYSILFRQLFNDFDTIMPKMKERYYFHPHTIPKDILTPQGVELMKTFRRLRNPDEHEAFYYFLAMSGMRGGKRKTCRRTCRRSR